MTACKIRAFFKEVKKAAKKEGGAIGFIEEIDAVGVSRGGVERSVEHRDGGFSVSRFVGGGSGGMVNELLIQLQSFDQPLLGGRIRNWFIDLLNLFLPANHQF